MNWKYPHCKVIFLTCAALIVNLTGAENSHVTLSDFETPEQLQELWKPLNWLQEHPGQWCPQGVKLEQSQKHVSQGMFSARITFPNVVAKGKGWPQMFCCPKVRDWSAYKTLALDAYSTLPKPIDLQLRIDSAGKNVWLRFQIEPKHMTDVRFTIADLSRQIDLRRIDCIVIFVDEVPEPFDMFIDNVRLIEKGGEERLGETGSGRIGETEMKKVTVTRAKATPNVDGNITDMCWQAAEWHTDFHPLGFPQKKAEPATSFAMLHDGENLYIAVRLDEPEPQKLKAKVSERDGWVWTDDCVEIFLDTEGRSQRYYHLVINCKGVLYDAQRGEGGASGYPEWDCSAKVSAIMHGTGWAVEMSIPFAELSFSAERNSKWRINISRERYAGGRQELFTFAPLAGTFHRPQEFAVAEVKDVDLTPFLWEVKPPTDAKVFPKRGEMIYEAKMEFENLSSAERMIDVEVTLKVGEKGSSANYPNMRLGGQSKREQALSIAIPQLGSGTLTINLSEPSSKRVVCRRQFPVVLSYTPLVVEVLRPHYRNSIFATQKVDALQLQVTTSVAEGERSDYRFEFELLSEGKVLKKQATRVASETFKMSIPLPKRLRYGDYEMKGQLVHTSGKVLAEWRDTLRVLAPYRGEVRFDENWVTLVDGKPFVPFGTWIYEYERLDRQHRVGEAAKWGFTVILDPTFSYYPDDESRIDPTRVARGYVAATIGQRLNVVAQSGLRLVFPAFPGFWREGGADWKKPLSSEEEKLLRSYVRKWKGHPAIFTWLVSEEPEETPASVERLEKVYAILKEEDPYHPAVFVPNSIAGMEKYKGCADVIMPDPYPFFLKGGGAVRGMDYTTRFIQAAVKIARGRKAVWITPEAQDPAAEGWNLNCRAPNPLELRNQLYQAVIAGAKGFIWYHHGLLDDNAQARSAMIYLAKEVQLLRDAILARESLKGFTVEPADKHWHLSRREVGEHTYLFAVSTFSEAKEASFTVPNLKARRLFVVGKGREVQVKGGRFTDRFEPYATHIYTTNKEAIKGLSILSVFGSQ